MAKLVSRLAGNTRTSGRNGLLVIRTGSASTTQKQMTVYNGKSRAVVINTSRMAHRDLKMADKYFPKQNKIYFLKFKHLANRFCCIWQKCNNNIIIVLPNTTLSSNLIQKRHLKARVKLPLCLTKHHAMKTYRGVEVSLHAFLTSAPDRGEWSASRPGRLNLVTNYALMIRYAARNFNLKL